MTYLILAAVLIAIGVCVVLFLHRPRSMEQNVSHFAKARDAIAPERRRSRRSRR